MTGLTTVRRASRLAVHSARPPSMPCTSSIGGPSPSCTSTWRAGVLVCPTPASLAYPTVGGETASGERWCRPRGPPCRYGRRGGQGSGDRDHGGRAHRQDLEP